MTTILHPAAQRGHVNLGWLDSHHSFSFGHWYDPGKIHFGALRVLNDDVVRGGAGFGTHPHDNMEIVSIPLKGALAHKDSTGTDGIIETGDVQIMSAGSGIQHSEYNASSSDTVNFLQIWVFPAEKNIKPRYDQRKFERTDRENKWQVVVSPNKDEGGLWINQDARFALTHLSGEKSLEFVLSNPAHGAYVYLIDGKVEIDGQELGKRDALGISNAPRFNITAHENSDVLVIEVPMNLN